MLQGTGISCYTTAAMYVTNVLEVALYRAAGATRLRYWYDLPDAALRR